MSIEALFRKGVLEMASYSPIEPPDQIAKRLGLPEDQIVKLDANENPYGVSPAVLAELAQARYLHIYPDPAQKAVREEIGVYAGVSADSIVAGAGADELIDLLCRLMLNPGDKVLTFIPTFSYYKHVVELNGGRMVEALRREDYSIDIDAVRELDLDGIKIVLLCSPNNPSGNLLEPEVLDYFLSKNMLVVVDEAYFEFSRQSFVPKIAEADNLIVLRTFSKCFGLAGLRVGYGVMSPLLQQAIMKIKPPYSVNMAAEVALRVCLANRDQFEAQVARMIVTRDRVIDALSKHPLLDVTPSRSNFILTLVKEKQAKALRDQLEQRGILLRYFDTPLLRNHLRISVGTEEQMDRFLDEFFRLLGD